MRRHCLSSIRCFPLFPAGFAVCLWLNYVAIAQPTDLLQQGVERYWVGDILGLIAAWQTALIIYQKANVWAKVEIAPTPGLRLTSPKPLNTEDLRTLALRVTQAATSMRKRLIRWGM